MKRFPVSFRLLGGFQPVMGGLGSAVNADLVHEFLVGGDSGFQFFQLFPSGVLQKVKSNLAAMLRQERTKEVRRDWER